MERTDRLQWLLDEFLRETPDAEYACVFSNDGLPMQRSSNMERDQAEWLGAMASGKRSLALETAAKYHRGAVVMDHIQFDRGFMSICAAGHGANLVVLTRPDVGHDKLPDLAWAMKRLIDQVRDYLTASPRPA